MNHLAGAGLQSTHQILWHIRGPLELFSTDIKTEVIPCPSAPSRFDHSEVPSWPNNKWPEELFSLTGVIFEKGLASAKIVNGSTWWSSRVSSAWTIQLFHCNTFYTRHILSILLNWGCIKIKDKLYGRHEEQSRSIHIWYQLGKRQVSQQQIAIRCL